MAIASPSGTRPRGAARREALLDAVLRIVAEVGPDAVTHRRVAEAAGLPLASTTYYFDSKEHLLTAALERAADHDIARLHNFLDRASGRARDPLSLAVEAILGPEQKLVTGSRSEHPLGHGTRASLLATYALMLEAARRPSLREINRRWTDAYLEALDRLLSLAGSSDPRGDATILLAAADGLLVEHLASDRTARIGPQLHRLAGALVGR